MQDVPKLEVITTDKDIPVRCFLSEDKGSYVPYHYHPALELIFVLQGSMQYAVMGDTAKHLENLVAKHLADSKYTKGISESMFRQAHLPECSSIPALDAFTLKKVFGNAAQPHEKTAFSQENTQAQNSSAIFTTEQSSLASVKAPSSLQPSITANNCQGQDNLHTPFVLEEHKSGNKTHLEQSFATDNVQQGQSDESLQSLNAAQVNHALNASLGSLDPSAKAKSMQESAQFNQAYALENSLEHNRINLHYTYRSSSNTNVQVFGASAPPVNTSQCQQDKQQKQEAKDQQLPSDDKIQDSGAKELSTLSSSNSPKQDELSCATKNTDACEKLTLTESLDKAPSKDQTTICSVEPCALEQEFSKNDLTTSKDTKLKPSVLANKSEGIESAVLTHSLNMLASQSGKSPSKSTRGQHLKAIKQQAALQEKAKMTQPQSYAVPSLEELAQSPLGTRLTKSTRVRREQAQNQEYMPALERETYVVQENVFPDNLPYAGDFQQLDAHGINCVLFNSNELHTSRCQNYNCSVVVQIPDEFLLQSLGLGKNEKVFFALAVASPECRQRMQGALAKLALLTLSGTSRHEVEGKEIRFKQALYTLLECLLEIKICTPSLIQGSDSESKMRERIYPILDMLNTNYMQEFSLNQVADMIHVHPNYFCRIFKQVVGQTFYAYLTEIRLCRIYQDLISSSDPLEDIVHRHGVKLNTYFFAQFKRRFGITSSALRRRYNTQFKS